MIAIAQPSLLAVWRRQMGRPSRRAALPRPLAALGYLTSGAVVDGLVEIENLVLVVLYDELHDDGRLSLTLAGYSGARVPWGVQWGGVEHNLFFKDLLLRPRPQAYGRCLDTRHPQLLELALRMDRLLDRFGRYTHLGKERQLVLPRLWAGFRTSCLPQLTGEGPELAAAAAHTGQSPEELLRQSRRQYEGLALFPMEWVSHHWEQATAVFADLQGFPTCQVFSLTAPELDLVGFRGAAQFDLLHSRFRRAAHAAQSVTVGGY